MPQQLAYQNKGQIAEQINKSLNLIIAKVPGQASHIRLLIADFYNKALLDYLNMLFEIENGGLNDQKLFHAETSAIAIKGNALEKNISNNILIKAIKKDFRVLVGPFAYQSLIVKRAFEKPKGYPGDFELLEIIYDNRPITDPSKKVGRLFDGYFLRDELAVAVRERKDKMSELLAEFLRVRETPELNITNFASGSMRDIRDLLSKTRLKQRVNFNCIDFDAESLEFSKSQLKKWTNPNFVFLKEDVIALSLKKSIIKSLSGQDLVYSIGLIDYLPDRVLQNFVSYSYGLVQQDGQLVLSHKDQDVYPPLVQDWFCDWSFYERDRSKVLDIITNAGVPSSSIEIVPLKVRSIYYIIISKK